MKISGLSAKFPSKKMSNSDVVEVLRSQSQAFFNSGNSSLLRRLEQKLDESGIESRYWFDKNEPWYPTMKAAIDEALEKAQVERDEIDLVIYSSVFRRVLEPGMSTLIASAYGIHNANCFDLIEACAGWLRAMEVAQNFLKGGSARNILVLNAEAGVHEGEYGFETFKISSEDDLESSYSALTLGEAVSATVLSAEEDDFLFNWSSHPKYADLCTVGLPDTNPAGDILGDLRINQKAPKRFTCYAGKMNTVGFKKCYKLLQDTKSVWQSADAIVPHAHTLEGVKRMLAKSKSDHPLLSTFPNNGNTASCSLPLGISQGVEKGIIKSGSKIFCIMTAAGLSMGTVALTL